MFCRYQKTIGKEANPFCELPMKYEPFLFIVDNQMFKFGVFMRDTFPRVIQNELQQGFPVEVGHGYHFVFVVGTFGFNDNANISSDIFPVVNH